MRSAADRLIYFDNAATSFPKPRAVLAGMVEAYAEIGVSPGRGSYDLSEEASRYVDDVRQSLADFFDAPAAERVVFTSNATDALNLAIQGMVAPGDHVVSTRLEHNSVLRPLMHLREGRGVAFDLVPFAADGLVNPDDIARAIRSTTRLVVVTHASQVLGTVQPIVEIAAVCVERGVPLLVDAAQTAGQVPVRLRDSDVSAIAFTGHKALMGPAGIGGLVVSPEVEIEPTRFGGTGVDSENLTHTRAYPHRLEAGTLNLPGVIGLALGVAAVQEDGMTEVHRREMRLMRRLREALAAIPGVVVHSPRPRPQDVPIVTCNVAGIAPGDVGAILDADYNVAVRTGLHCAPLVHRDLGTLERGGAVRFSAGPFTSEEHVDRVIEAITVIACDRASA